MFFTNKVGFRVRRRHSKGKPRLQSDDEKSKRGLQRNEVFVRKVTVSLNAKNMEQIID
jgi:hypothetical protein